MQEIQLVNYKGYPIYFQIKGKSVSSKPIKLKAEGQSDKTLDANIVYGVSDLTVAVECPLQVGDICWFNKDKHTVSEVLETRNPKGIGHPDHVVFQSIKCDFERTVIS